MLHNEIAPLSDENCSLKLEISSKEELLEKLGGDDSLHTRRESNA
jgi:hypothetical protein